MYIFEMIKVSVSLRKIIQEVNEKRQNVVFIECYHARLRCAHFGQAEITSLSLSIGTILLRTDPFGNIL
jgi:hypothetical protein